jgi:hypothetical protein
VATPGGKGIRRWVYLLVPLALVLGCLALVLYIVYEPQMHYRMYSRKGLEAKARGDDKEAEANFILALGVMERVYDRKGKEIWKMFDVWPVLDGVVEIYMRHTRYGHVERVFRKIMPGLMQEYGEDNVKLTPYYEALAKSLAARQRYTDAELFYKQTANILVQAYGPTDPRTLSVIRDYETMLRAIGRGKDADRIAAKLKELSTPTRP